MIVFTVCHLPCKIVRLIHIWYVPSDVVHVISVSVSCAETLEAPLGFILAWIIQQPVCGGFNTWLLHNSDCLPSQFIPDNAPEWSVSGALHDACQNI